MEATITAKEARSLAVSYEAYMSAVRTHDDNGIIVWGTALVEDQRNTGIELQDSFDVAEQVSELLNRKAS